MRHSIHSIFYEQAAALEAEDRLDEALALLYQGHRWAPDDPELWQRMGVLSFLMTDRDWLATHGRESGHLGDMGAVNADLYLERACALDPASAQTRFWRGWVRHALYQDAAGARHWLHAALALEPRHPYAHAALARLEAAERLVGFEARAIAHLESAIASLPESARFHYDLGACLVGAGEHEAAREAFRRAMACGPLPLGSGAIARYLADTFHSDGEQVSLLIARYYPAPPH